MSSETKWTPGPWTVSGIMENGSLTVSAPKQRIVIADIHNAASFSEMLVGAMRRGGGGFDQSDAHSQFANAHLIAAAPELYRELTAMVEMFHGYQGMEMIRARAALAAADGSAER